MIISWRGLVKRNSVLLETYHFLLKLWDVTADGSRRVELLEGFLNQQEFSDKEKAFLFYHLIDAAFKTGFDRGFAGTRDNVAPGQTVDARAKAVGHA